MRNDTNDVEQREEDKQPITVVEDPLLYRMLFLMGAIYILILAFGMFFLIYADDGIFWTILASILASILGLIFFYYGVQLLIIVFISEEKLIRKTRYWKKSVEGQEIGMGIFEVILYKTCLCITILLARFLTICLRYIFPKNKQIEVRFLLSTC